MAIKKAYTCKDKLDSMFDITTTTTDAETAINAAIDIVDNITQRNFVAESASARLYDGNGENELRIDECIEITKVERGYDPYGDSKEEITAGGYNGYYLLPANYEERGTPITHVHLRDRYFVRGFQNHQITAKWGYSETCPSDVSWATTVLACGIYQHEVTGTSGGVSSEKIGNYSVSYGEENGKTSWADYNRAMIILEQYRRIIL